MHSLIIALIPPALVLGIALCFHRVYTALCVGIIAAGFIATHGAPLAAFQLVRIRLFHDALDKDHIYTLGFLMLLGILIECMHKSGGVIAYSRSIQKRLANALAAQKASLTLSTTLFIDDYVSSLMVGSVMQPIMDIFGVARAKLAFLINATAAPLCVIVPATSWCAMILGVFQSAGISESGANPIVQMDPYAAYLTMIPYLFYPCFIVISAWIIVIHKISWGSMAQLERASKPLQEAAVHMTDSHYVSDLVAPIITLILGIMGAIAYSGKMWRIGSDRTFMQALQQADTLWAFFVASIVALMVGFILLWIHSPRKRKIIPRIMYDGSILMFNSLLLLTLAWTLGALLRLDLHTGTHLAHAMQAVSLPWILPLFFFFCAMLTSAATGSAWGTIALLVPIGVQMLETLNALDLLSAALGALIGGTIAGAHFSPISDATILAATSARVPHSEHIATMVPYALPALIGSVVATLFLGLCYRGTIPFGCGAYIPFIIGLLTMLTILARHKRR